MPTLYNKLVRDRIPAIIAASGRQYAVARLDDAAYAAALRAKLVEEAKLERNGLRVDATSWSGGGFVSASVETCAQQVADTMQSTVADFVEMYRAMNPPSANR